MIILYEKLIENGVDEWYFFLKVWKNFFFEKSDKIIVELGE